MAETIRPAGLPAAPGAIARAILAPSIPPPASLPPPPATPHGPLADPTQMTVGDWAAQKGALSFVGALLPLYGWAIDKVVDEANFDAAIDAARNVESR